MNGSQVAVVGAGAFGTALACVVARAQPDPVALLARTPDAAAELIRIRQNARYLPDVDLPENVLPLADLANLSAAGTVLLAVPSQAQRATTRRLAPHLARNTTLVICAKGLEQATGKRLSDAVAEEVGAAATVAVLSGPGFAADIARGLPTAMTLAAPDMEDAEHLAAILSGATFRLYASDDVVGVEIGGALKNVLAIACGIVEGAGLGESARAAVIARGLTELTRFAVAHGAKPETIAGLSGLGDLVLTATSRQSRNLRFGLALGCGDTAASLLGLGSSLTEGAYTAAVASERARALGIDMPITDAVSAIIDGRLTVEDALRELMSRPLTKEGL